MSFISELTSTVPEGDMESIYTELALYGSNNECARADNIYFPISEVCNGMISLMLQYIIEDTAHYVGFLPSRALAF